MRKRNSTLMLYATSIFIFCVIFLVFIFALVVIIFRDQIGIVFVDTNADVLAATATAVGTAILAVATFQSIRQSQSEGRSGRQERILQEGIDWTEKAVAQFSRAMALQEFLAKDESHYQAIENLADLKALVVRGRYLTRLTAFDQAVCQAAERLSNQLETLRVLCAESGEGEACGSESLKKQGLAIDIAADSFIQQASETRSRLTSM